MVDLINNAIHVAASCWYNFPAASPFPYGYRRYLLKHVDIFLHKYTISECDLFFWERGKWNVVSATGSRFIGATFWITIRTASNQLPIPVPVDLYFTSRLLHGCYRFDLKQRLQFYKSERLCTCWNLHVSSVQRFRNDSLQVNVFIYNQIIITDI